jgi:N-acylneuraminate cytidylyltransferase
MNIAIIPARGGSKRIPHKNIKDFCGKPIIAWSIEAAQNSKLFDRIIVSSDDPDIIQVAQAAGAEVPFLRPPELSDDHTPTIPVIRHAIEWVQENGSTPIFVCCLYPTAPFVTLSALTKSFTALKTSAETDFVISATEYPFPIERSLRILPNGQLRMNHPEHAMTRSQDLPSNYHDAGQFYWGRASSYLKENSFFTNNSKLHILKTSEVQDIDTPDDWERAELMFHSLQQLRYCS